MISKPVLPWTQVDSASDSRFGNPLDSWDSIRWIREIHTRFAVDSRQMHNRLACYSLCVVMVLYQQQAITHARFMWTINNCSTCVDSQAMPVDFVRCLVEWSPKMKARLVFSSKTICKECARDSSEIRKIRFEWIRFVEIRLLEIH